MSVGCTAGLGSLDRAMDGRIMRCGITHANQLTVTLPRF